MENWVEILHDIERRAHSNSDELATKHCATEWLYLCDHSTCLILEPAAHWMSCWVNDGEAWHGDEHGIVMHKTQQMKVRQCSVQHRTMQHVSLPEACAISGAGGRSQPPRVSDNLQLVSIA